MKKHKICKILLVILAIFLCVAFYELLGICVAYKKQPEVSNTTKKEMDIVVSTCEPEYEPPLSRPPRIKLPECAAGLNADPLRLEQKDQDIIFG